jgi:hypothetical protein
MKDLEVSWHPINQLLRVGNLLESFVAFYYPKPIAIVIAFKSSRNCSVSLKAYLL